MVWKAHKAYCPINFFNEEIGESELSSSIKYKNAHPFLREEYKSPFANNEFKFLIAMYIAFRQISCAKGTRQQLIV